MIEIEWFLSGTLTGDDGDRVARCQGNDKRSMVPEARCQEACTKWVEVTV